VATSIPGPTATTDPNAAPSYEQIKENIRRITVEANSTPGNTSAYDKVREYVQSLTGKQVQGWHTWVAGVAKPYDSPDYVVSPIYEDPFAQGAVITGTGSMEQDVYFALKGLTNDQAKQYKVGQELVVNGVLTSTQETGDGIMVTKIEPVPVDPGTAPDTTGMVVSLERGVCFGACPVYTVKIHGDGKVVYDGQGFVKTRGHKEATIGADKVKELAAFIEKVGYFSLNDMYTNQDVTDNPSAITSVTLGDKSKGIDHYYGDRSAPTKLTLLEAKIDEIANTDQWINEGPDPKEKGPDR
jgi:hypothetical protein